MRWWIVLLVACGTSGDPDASLDASVRDSRPAADAADVTADVATAPPPLHCDSPSAQPDLEPDVRTEQFVFRDPSGGRGARGRPLYYATLHVGDHETTWGASCWRVLDASERSNIRPGEIAESDSHYAIAALTGPEAWVELEGRAWSAEGQLWATHARVEYPGLAVARVSYDAPVGYAESGLLATEHTMGERSTSHTIVSVLTETRWLERRDDDGALVLVDHDSSTPVGFGQGLLFLVVADRTAWGGEAVIAIDDRLSWLDEDRTFDAPGNIDAAVAEYVLVGSSVYAVDRMGLTRLDLPPIGSIARSRWRGAYALSENGELIRLDSGETAFRFSAAEHQEIGRLIGVSASGEYWGTHGYVRSLTPTFGARSTRYEDAYGERIEARASHIDYHLDQVAFVNAANQALELVMFSLNPDD